MNFVIHKGTSDHVSAQIARRIERAIREGEYLPGERLPSVRKLKRDLGVAYNTVLRAYAVLMKTGFAYSVPSTGTFVSHHAPPPPVLGNDDDDPAGWRERRHWIRLAEALIVQTERCGVDITDALSEVALRAQHRRSRIERELRKSRDRQTYFEKSLAERQAAEAARQAAQRAVDVEEIREGLAKEKAQRPS